MRADFRGRDRGSASIEFLGFLPVLLLVALAGVQLGLVAFVGSQAGTAARAAARTEARQATQGQGHDAGVASVSGWLRQDVRAVDIGGDGTAVTATVTISVPSVLPGIQLLGPVTRSATMPGE